MKPSSSPYYGCKKHCEMLSHLRKVLNSRDNLSEEHRELQELLNIRDSRIKGLRQFDTNNEKLRETHNNIRQLKTYKEKLRGSHDKISQCLNDEENKQRYLIKEMNDLADEYFEYKEKNSSPISLMVQFFDSRSDQPPLFRIFLSLPTNCFVRDIIPLLESKFSLYIANHNHYWEEHDPSKCFVQFEGHVKEVRAHHSLYPDAEALFPLEGDTFRRSDGFFSLKRFNRFDILRDHFFNGDNPFDISPLEGGFPDEIIVRIMKFLPLYEQQVFSFISRRLNWIYVKYFECVALGERGDSLRCLMF